MTTPPTPIATAYGTPRSADANRDGVWNTALGRRQTSNPRSIPQRIGKPDAPQANKDQGEQASGYGHQEAELEQARPADPDRARRQQLGVAATENAPGVQKNSDDQDRETGAQMPAHGRHLKRAHGHAEDKIGEDRQR